MSLEVTRLTIADALDRVHSGKWLVPGFQREFVWTHSQVFELLNSVFRSRPIGLITIWAQPEGNPQTTYEPLKLKAAEYKGYEQIPADVKFILDGRQRLTALAMAFGGLREADGRKAFSGRWFLYLDAKQDTDEYITYKKAGRELARLGNPSVANYLGQALVPLDDYRHFDQYSGNVLNRTIYADNVQPSDEELESRRTLLASYERTFLQFQIPVAEIPSTITLPQVCDIFDVLNTTGTRVSVFDLIHNQLYARYQGGMSLRSIFRSAQEEKHSLGLVCDDRRPEFFNQIVTSCYIGEGLNLGEEASIGRPRSIKGGDLIATPPEFYERVAQELSRVDTFFCDLFSRDLLSGDFSLPAIAYPASILIYTALRWHQSQRESHGRISTHRINKMFRAFYWANLLTNRYDQGFLTKFADDLKCMYNGLIRFELIQSDQEWAIEADRYLGEQILSGRYERVQSQDIQRDILDGDIRGATKQGIEMFIRSRMTVPIVARGKTGAGNSESAIHLHHIYPRNWCKMNRANWMNDETDESIVNSYANLAPLPSNVNWDWDEMSPATALNQLGIQYEENTVAFNQVFISQEMWDILTQNVPQPMAFWAARSNLIAEELCRLQYIR